VKRILGFLSSVLGAIFFTSCSSGTERALNSMGESEDGSSEIRITVTLPMAACLVPVKELPSDIKKSVSLAIEKHAPEPVRELAAKMLESSLIKIEEWRKDRLPPELVTMLEYTGSTSEELKSFREARKFLFIQAVGRPGWPPAHEFGTRAAAASVAMEINSTVVDLYIPASVHIDQAFDNLPPKVGSAKLSNWLKVINSAGDKGLWMTSRGLARVGLPDLQSVDVPPQLENSWSYVMTGLAWKIVKITQPTLHADTKELSLPAIIEVSDKDIDEAFGKKVTTKSDAAASFHLSLEKGRDGSEYLTIVKPRNDRRTFGEYLADLSRQLMGASEEPVVTTTKTDSMERAMATAISELPKIRDRFLNNKLPKNGKLILKFRVRRGADSEYLWASVTSWKELGEANVFCGNDSAFDPNLRTGKPLTLNLDSVVDWAVMVGDEIIEGGYTNKVLQDRQNDAN